MFRRTIKTIQDVVEWGLCIGCGACYFACQEGAVSLLNVEGVGIRPKFDATQCDSCTNCLSICPGYRVDGDLEVGIRRKESDPDHEYGPSLEVWEGYAKDPEIRFRASSGGILTAISLHCLEQEGMGFVLHTGMDQEKPWTNTTVQSSSKIELLARTGSRYAPASPCDGLLTIEDSELPCVFIGKPCDTAAVAMLRRQRPKLDRQLGLVMTFFCAGTPSTRGTLDLIQSLNVPTDSIQEVHYRGEGWPGRFRVIAAEPSEDKSYSYRESWARLASYRSLRCHICPDGLGRVADISCGDSWGEYKSDVDAGRSLVIVRTRRGQDILHRAIAAGYVHLTRVDQKAVLAAQPSLLSRRKEIFGRLLARQLLFIPNPKFLGFSLFDSWIRLPLLKKIQTIAGTITRALQRNQWRRQPLFLKPQRTERSATSLARHD